MIVGHILLFSYYFPGDKTRAEQGQMHTERLRERWKIFFNYENGILLY